MQRIRSIILTVVLFWEFQAPAQLAVMVSPLKTTGNKAVVPLSMKNNFAEKVESARAVCFLMDEDGKVVAQSTKWVIGGAKERPALETAKDVTYNFVITASKPFITTNLTPKLTFSRVVLAGGKVADVSKEVTVTQAPK